MISHFVCSSAIYFPSKLEIGVDLFLRHPQHGGVVLRVWRDGLNLKQIPAGQFGDGGCHHGGVALIDIAGVGRAGGALPGHADIVVFSGTGEKDHQNTRGGLLRQGGRDQQGQQQDHGKQLFHELPPYRPSLYCPVRIAAMVPPSINRSVPVMNPACSPSRKAPASAISSEVPVRSAAEASIIRW